MLRIKHVYVCAELVLVHCGLYLSSGLRFGWGFGGWGVGFVFLRLGAIFGGFCL